MKKFLALILAVLMVFSLVACGKTKEKKISKEEMFEQAAEIGDYLEAYKSNKLLADEEYVGNIYEVTGYISDISEEGAKITADQGYFLLDLEKEELISITMSQQITVVGKFESLIKEENEDGAIEYNAKMSNCYILTDRYEVSGELLFYYKKIYNTITGKYESHNGDSEYWTFGLDVTDNSFHSVSYSLVDEFPVEHHYGQETKTVKMFDKEYENGVKMTISSKIYLKGDGYGDSIKVLKDVKLISIDN